MYAYEWDAETGGYVLTSTPLPFSKEPRPVYYQEMDLLGFDQHWQYDKDDTCPYMWAEANKYWYRGKLIAQTRGGTLYQAPELIVMEEAPKENEQLFQVDIPNTIEKNRGILKSLVSATIKSVYNTYVEYKNKVDIFYVAFSGGKDSVVTLDIVQRAIPHEDFIVLFGDTQMEFVDTYEVIDKIKKQCEIQGIRFYVSRSVLTPGETWDLIGPPAQKMRWCCSVHKTAPQILLLRELTKNPHFRGMAMMGVRGDESIARSKYDDLNYGTKHKGQYDYYPILNWNSAELFLYIYQENLVLNDTYKRGNNRAGCLVCPMASKKGSWVREQLYGKSPDYIHSTTYFNNMIIEKTIAKGLSDQGKKEFMEMEGWKSRHNGSKLYEQESRYEESFENGKLKIKLAKIASDWKVWFKTLGEVTYENKDNILIKFNEDVFRVTIHDCEGGIEFQLFSNNSKNEILFISALKNVLRKAAYCIGCRVCEANCPNGYIKFHDGNVEIDDRCVHCLLCHKVSSSSCWVAESHRLPKEKMKMATSIDRYKTLGVQFAWVQDYLSKKDSFWNDNTLGTMMIAPLKAFLADANVSVKNHITDFGLLIASLGAESEIAWALMLCNAVYTSEFYWWIKNIEFNKKYSPAEILALLSEEMDSEKAQKNVVSAMKNICYSNPILGKELGLGNCECDQKGRATFLQSIIREPWSDPDPLVILYSLYKFAEACGGYYQFTLSTLMDTAIERDGISPTEIFGLSGETMERLLNGLSINYPEFIKCSFKMDLDSITLREDKTSQDVLTLFA